MIRFRFPDAQDQIDAILTDPGGYFARARANAWRQAGEEVAADLAELARRNHATPAHRAE
ncbi:hypothetical protein H7X46_07720 [Pseudonocardia sp. C8]|uniref:hypothetical protein n=1 Tax=Pseudonocardia sp. C8 TaxID=2762759 RepID=UPI0016430753|nr:hypothetical protein [Pseudonocardia sp. C8]MBC3190949.1 hypothetical protein [Pseudonocardia sp. C8]